jgi:hypothetical protein
VTTSTPARWYPNQPPGLPDETDEQYTNRLLGIGQPSPYDHQRNRQCSIGWHNECSDRSHSGQCGCPCHGWRRSADEHVAAWNAAHPVGTRVTLPEAPDEQPTVTTGPAVVEQGWPYVPLEGFPHPVGMAWLRAETNVSAETVKECA